jgi:hypothetical protein
MTQPANHAIRDTIPQTCLLVYHLTQLSIKKGILAIELKDGTLLNRSNNEKNPYSGHVGNGSKSNLIVTTVFLLKGMCDKTGLLALKRAIRSSLDLMDPFASNRGHQRQQRDKIPSTGVLQSRNLISHGVLSFRADSSLSVGG